MNLFADNCIPIHPFRAFAAELAEMRPRIRAEHQRDWQISPSADDEEIVRRVKRNNKRFMILTQDNSTHDGGEDPRMPLVAPRNGVTCIVLARKFGQWNAQAKIDIVRGLIPELRDAFNGPRGLRYRIRLVHGTPRLVPWPVSS